VTVTQSTRRSKSDVPTIAEAGVPGYECDGWYGLLAPAATPPAIIARLNRELSATVVTREMKQRLLAAGVDAGPSTPAEFHARITRDIARWAEVVKTAKIVLEKNPSVRRLGALQPSIPNCIRDKASLSRC
jgi:tripartite-type tricarboxylate transporter receptor subunit TctC